MIVCGNVYPDLAVHRLCVCQYARSGCGEGRRAVEIGAVGLVFAELVIASRKRTAFCSHFIQAGKANDHIL